MDAHHYAEGLKHFPEHGSPLESAERQLRDTCYDVRMLTDAIRLTSGKQVPNASDVAKMYAARHPIGHLRKWLRQSKKDERLLRRVRRLLRSSPGGRIIIRHPVPVPTLRVPTMRAPRERRARPAVRSAASSSASGGDEPPPPPSRPELRPYQVEAIEAAREKLSQYLSTLVVLPTGAGKTVVIADIARRVLDNGGRVLVLAHRQELISQAAAKIESATGIPAECEQGRSRASLDARVVVASVQTLARAKRLEHWPTDHFALVIIDEAHHATADSYRAIRGHFSAAKVLGFTATPDRGDGTPLSEVFDSVAYERSMLDLIRGGFLVPLRAQTINIEAFDIDGAKVLGGDLSERDLSTALGREGVVELLSKLIVQHSERRPTLVFVPGVERAHEVEAALNKFEPGSAATVDGTTPPDVRTATFAAFADGRLRYVTNVGVATEGTDLPRCSCVAIARPTMSRALFTQMAGRGVRLHPESEKEDCLLLNFVPSNARHRLVAPVDALLGADVDDAVRDLATNLAGKQSLVDAVEAAMKRGPAVVRGARLAKYRATVEAWDPFGIVSLDENSVDTSRSDEPMSDALRSQLEAYGVTKGALKTFDAALGTAVLNAIKERETKGLCSLRQARQLARHGLNADVSAADARVAMDALAGMGWTRPPDWLRRDPRFAVQTEVAA